MSKHIFQCPECSIYTLNKNCPSGHGNTISAHPPKFSPDDKYASYRREIKLKELKKHNLY